MVRRKYKCKYCNWEWFTILKRKRPKKCPRCHNATEDVQVAMMPVRNDPKPSTDPITIDPIQVQRRLIIDRTTFLRAHTPVCDFSNKWVCDLYDDLDKIDNSLSMKPMPDSNSLDICPVCNQAYNKKRKRSCGKCQDC